MRLELYSNNVITEDQQKIIDVQIGRQKMEYLLIQIIIPSLKAQCSEKYKLLLKAMGESEDIVLRRTAKTLVSCLLYRTVITYIYSYYIMFILYLIVNGIICHHKM